MTDSIYWLPVYQHKSSKRKENVIAWLKFKKKLSCESAAIQSDSTITGQTFPVYSIEDLDANARMREKLLVS